MLDKCMFWVSQLVEHPEETIDTVLAFARAGSSPRDPAAHT